MRAIFQNKFVACGIALTALLLSVAPSIGEKKVDAQTYDAMYCQGAPMACPFNVTNCPRSGYYCVSPLNSGVCMGPSTSKCSDLGEVQCGNLKDCFGMDTNPPQRCGNMVTTCRTVN